jgi:hypothetical protein
VELAAWREAEVELKALRSLVAWVRDLVLGRCQRVVLAGDVHVRGSGAAREPD